MNVLKNYKENFRLENRSRKTLSYHIRFYLHFYDHQKTDFLKSFKKILVYKKLKICLLHLQCIKLNSAQSKFTVQLVFRVNTELAK